MQIVTWSGASGIIGTHSGFSLYTGMLVVSIISLGLAVRSSRVWPYGRSPIYLLAAGVALTQALSLVASAYPIASLSTPFANLRDLVYFVITLGLLRVTGRYRLTAIVVVGTIAVLCGLTLVQQYGLHNSTTLHGFANIPSAADVGSATARHSGPEPDENFWGRTIVLAFGWCAALSLTVSERRRKLLWITVGLVLAGGEYLTSSRGGWVAFGLEVVVVVVIAFRRRPRYLLAVPLVALMVAVVVPGLTSRLSTLGELSSSSAGSTDPSLIGRLQAQEVGYAMFKANPVTGVGVGNFIPVEPSFLGRPGIVQTGTLLAPHDLYLEILAEQGVVGLGAWLLFFGGALLLAVRARTLARRAAGDPRLDPVLRAELSERAGICTGTLLGLSFWAVASVVLHLSDFNLLLTFVAVAAAADMDVRDRVADKPWAVTAPVRPALRPVTTRDRAGLAARMVFWPGLAVVAGLALTLVVPVYVTRYQAKATAAVYPNSSNVSAYTWYTVYGTDLLPTFAEIAATPRLVADAEHRRPGSLDPNVSVKSSGDNSVGGGVSSNVVSVTVIAPHPAEASSIALATLASSRSYMENVAPYQIESVNPTLAVQVHRLDGRALTIDLAIAVLLVGGGLIRSSAVWRSWRSWRRIRRRRVAQPMPSTSS
jgi:hypothetical protein